MTGLWNRHREVPDVDIFEDLAATTTQRGGEVRVGSDLGVIDPASGDLYLRTINLDFPCAPFDALGGTVAADGLTYAIDGFHWASAPDGCVDFDATETGTRCGTGVIDPGEECDDGNLGGGDGCGADCRVEQCWSCNGEPSSCAPAAGGACDDGDGCTSSDSCAADGSCAGTAVVCEPCLQCDTTLGCVAAPLSPCKVSLQPKKSLLRIKNLTDAHDSFYWKWNKGEATALPEFGDPPSGGGYTVGVYDESGPTTLLFHASMPDGESCGGQSCWRASGGAGYRYRNRAATPEGLVVTRLRSGNPAKAVVKGRGAHLSDRAAGLPSLPLAAELRVQLQGENGLCLETRHDASTLRKNDPVSGLFKARGAP